MAHERIGISQEMAMRVGLVSAGLWWAGFTLFTAYYLRESGVKERFRCASAIFGGLWRWQWLG